MRLLVVLGALAVGSTLVACAAEPADDAISRPSDTGSSADELRSLVLTDADDGKTVTVTRGQNVLVKLTSNPSTGYKWVVASTNRTFGYPASDNYVPPPGAAAAAAAAPAGAIGAPGIQRILWKTNSPLDMTGTHVVKLEYKREWEVNVAPARTFTFTVNVVAPPEPPPPVCAEIAPPDQDLCAKQDGGGGHVSPVKDEAGCTTGYECLDTK